MGSNGGFLSFSLQGDVSKMRIALICTRGGHLTETMQLLDAIEGYDFFFVIPHSVSDQELINICSCYIFKKGRYKHF